MELNKRAPGIFTLERFPQGENQSALSDSVGGLWNAHLSSYSSHSISVTLSDGNETPRLVPLTPPEVLLCAPLPAWQIDLHCRRLHDRWGGPRLSDHCVLHQVMTIYEIFVPTGVGLRLGSRCCATSCSTYSTIHNVGLMKLMGQNTVSIL